WHVSICTFLPDRIQFWIVNLKPSAIILMDVQSEILEYLQAHCTGFDVLFELPGGPLTKAGANVAKVDIRKEHHAVGIRATFDYSESASQIVARASAQIHDQPDIKLVHRLHHSFVLLRRDWRRMMTVNVNHGKLRAGLQILRHDQRRTRLILTDIRRWPFRLTAFGGTGTDLAGRLPRLRLK